jgi:carbon-monoxide dehydrogenase medium subunit
LGAVGPKMIIAHAAADCLIGTKLGENILSSFSSECSRIARPISDKRGSEEFRKDIIGVIAKRAATKAYARALGNN